MTGSGRRRAISLVLAAAAGAMLAALLPLLALGRSATARAANPTAATTQATQTTETTQTTGTTGTTQTTLFAPVATQTDPTSLWASAPIPVVAAAARAVQANAPLPPDILPTAAQIAAKPPDFNPACAPTFGPGVRPQKVCRLGDAKSKYTVVVIGDSHAGRWVPPLEKIGIQQGFAVVPLGKAGCQINVYNVNTAEWPCRSWYRWALAEDHALHPVITLVSFLMKIDVESTPGPTVSALQSILSQVTHGVYITDPPYQLQLPISCVQQPGATMGTCSTPVPKIYVPFMKDVAAMTQTDHFPVIPTLQWFCADGVCPMVIDDTLTLADRSHMTLNYSRALSDVLGQALDPILIRYGMDPNLAAQSIQTVTQTVPGAAHRAAR